MTLRPSLTRSAENSWKVSAQSPACKTNACPAAARASSDLRFRADPAKISGGRASSSVITALSASWSGHSGCCFGASERHESRVQSGTVILGGLGRWEYPPERLGPQPDGSSGDGGRDHDSAVTAR